MSIDSESLDNGVIKPERLGGKYRGARRDPSLPQQTLTGGGPERAEGPGESPTHDDLAGRRPVDEQARSGEPDPGHDRVELADRVGLRLLGAGDAPSSLSPLDLGDLTEPVFPAGDWSAPVAESLANHPLLRGLLLELPARGAAPSPEWLDRWFEAARSILELLYVQPVGRPR